MFGTFSSRTQVGGVASINRKTSRTSPDSFPSMPAVRPTWLRSVQGKPAATTSTLGSASRSLTSPTTGALKWRRNVAAAGDQYSQSRSASIPARWRPSSSPPIPEKSPTARTRTSSRKTQAKASDVAASVVDQKVVLTQSLQLCSDSPSDARIPG